MTSVRTTQKSSLLFRFFTIPFLLLLVIALAPTVGNFQNCDIITTVDQHQIYNLGDYWHSLRPSGGQPTRQLTIQRKNAQSTISLQNPSLPKAVP
ncbi:MAG: hypothetical protein ABIQ24_07745 [Nitrospiraceae bacterium]|jgi:hypothetical protein